ncbi:hypothetical protein JTE90_027037 [Oedothorax gibbosus]|uniref:Apoptotic chromatin condensation inducer in the nucleus n=1 Tax=Oedothorax gibbosus TaxID=931172 RepID=A0AAV6UTA1_9ARAC|nr:hypothetical protein JTE90_027037 [Oedothorax gibbosus]
MEDDGSVLLDGKTIANLRVVDLKLELEKRGLSKSGSKKDLVKRLKQQVEFEKLSQRKSTGDCDLKIELDADTEQNEFVQQYLAQQQKIYAQQKEVKRQVELEEIQKSGDEKESCDSTKGDEDKTEDESDTESKNEQVGKIKICLPPDKTTKDDVFREAVHPASSSNIEGPSKNHVSDDKHSFDSHTAKETFKEVNKDREKELSTAISSLLMVENAPVQDLAEDLSVAAEPDVKDVENDREKELSTAISSLLSVENSNKQVTEPEDLSVPDSGVIRTSHDDDREKDLATAVLSSLLVDQDVETKNEEYAGEPCEETPSEDAVAAKETSQMEPEAKPSSFVEGITKTEVAIEKRLSSAVEDSSKTEIEVTTVEKSSSSIVEDTLKNKADAVFIAKSLPDVKESSQMENKVDTVEDFSQVKTELTINTKSSSVVEESSHMKTDASLIKLNVTVESITSSTEKEASEIIEEKTSSDITNTSPVDSKVPVEAASSVCIEETSEVESSVVTQDYLVNVKEGNVNDQDKPFEEKSPSVVQEPPVESRDNSKGIQEEMSSKMNVSSVPYSLSDIQLPGSPATKPQTKSDSVHAQSDEEQTLNNTNSNITTKSKKPEEGDMNGKASKLEVRDGTSKDIQQGSDSEKPCQSKVSEAGNSKEEVKSDSSSGDEKVKSRDKTRKKKHDSSDDSRSPAKKSSESSRSRRRRNRSSSVEDRGRSRSKSPRGSKSSRRGRRRSPSSEKEHRSKARHKKSGSKKEKSKKREKRSPSSDRSPSPHKDRSPRKPYKVRRKEGNVSSEEERHSKTHRESPKKDAKVGLKARSGSSGDESNSKTHKEDTKMDERKDRSVSSSDEHNSRTRSGESQKKDSKSVRKDTSVSSGDERKSRTRSKESPKKLTEVSQREKSISPEKDFRNKDSEAMDVEQISQKLKSATEESPKKEHTRTSREKQSPTASDFETSSPESSPKKISHSTKRDAIKELKRKHSVSSDEDSKRTESPVKKSKPITPEDSPEPKESPEKKDFESSKEEPPASRRSRRDSSSDSKHQAKRTDSSRIRSPEKVYKDKFNKRSPSPKETRNRESSPEKADDKVSKAEVSDGELPSSRESSPATRTGERKPSTDSVVSKSGTMIVIRKEAPKQKLKIKRDNVVVFKKEEEEVAEKDREEVESKSTTETVETPEPIEEQKLEPGECPDIPPNTNYIRRKIVLSSRKQVDKPSDEPGTKKSKWGSFAASRKAKQTVSISTDSLKNWFPDFKILKEPEAIPEDLPSPVKEERDVEMTPIERVAESSEPKMIAVTRRLQPLPSEAALKPPTEPINDDELGIEPTPVLFVQNLVRPFTLLQLKELLGETGRMVEDGFWIDKIKSKCFVTYETVEEAVKTRKILNGARWPMSNPKILAVSFATEEDLSSHRSGLADQPKPLPPSQPEDDQPIRREREGRTRMVVPPLREWDKDKVSQDSPEKLDRRRDEDRPRDKKEAKKRGGLADDTPAKLLDDLFQKTKAVPCIYWLPLTQEQKKERDERRKQMNQERERRNQEREQENKRPRSRQRETRRNSPSRSRSPVTRRR